MMLCIPEVLTRAELEQLRTSLAGAEFADGKATAGYRGRRVKNNLPVPHIRRLIHSINQ